MNYSVLFVRLSSYARHRARKGHEITEDDLNATSLQEKILTVLFTVGIISYPIVITFLLAFKHDNFEGDVIKSWERYQLFYMINIIVITVLLVASTTASLRYMRKVFGEVSMKEEKSIKALLIIFCGTYVLRVLVTTTMYIYHDLVDHIFTHNHTYFMLSIVILWIIWDSIPLISMLVTHYKNFSSFVNEEILYCEYTVDDNQSDYMFSDFRSSFTSIRDLDN